MGDFFNKDYNFNINNVLFTTKDAQIFLKISFLVTFFTFSSVIRKHFEHNLRIFANFRVKTQKSIVSPLPFQNLQVLGGFFNKDYTFYTKNLYFTTKDTQSISKIRFLVTFLHF